MINPLFWFATIKESFLPIKLVITHIHLILSIKYVYIFDVVRFV